MSSRDARGEPWDGGPPGADSDYEDHRETLKYSINENRSRSQWQGSHTGYGHHPVNQHYNYEPKYSNTMYQTGYERQATYDYRPASYHNAQHSVPPSRRSRSMTPRSPEPRVRRQDAPVKKISHDRSRRRSSSSSSSSSSDSSSSSHSSSKTSQSGSSSASASSNRKRRQKKSNSRSLSPLQRSASKPRRSPSTPSRSPSTPRRSPSMSARSPSSPARSLSPPPRTSGKSNYREKASPYRRSDKKYTEEKSYKRKNNSPVSKSDYIDKSPTYKYRHSSQRRRREQSPSNRRRENSCSRSHRYRSHTPPPREHASRSPERKRHGDNDRQDRRRKYDRSSSSESERKVEKTRQSPASKRETAKDVHKSDVDRAKKLALDCQNNSPKDNEYEYESMPSPEFKPMNITTDAKAQSSNLRSEFDSMKMKTESIMSEDVPAASSAPQFKNDGSFLEMFKKMQEEAAKSEPAATVESVTVAPAGIKKPTLPFIGKRRGGRVLKTGIVKKAKAIDEQLVDNTPKDAWSIYMQEVKKYRDTSCEEERKTRPLVK